MSSNISFIFYICSGFGFGLIVALSIFGYLIDRNSKDINDFWRTMTLKLNDEWAAFYKQCVASWGKQTQVLIVQATNDAVEERDKQWRQAQTGKPISKPKPPSN